MLRASAFSRAWSACGATWLRRAPGSAVPRRLLCSTDSLKGKRVAVAMSGGVDSSVVAHLLKAQGLDVFGIHMQNWDEEEERGVHVGPGHCSSAQDLLDVRATCDRIGMELHQVKFVREYWNEVFEPLVQGYMDGVTPNPDVACNREIKFKVLLEHARALGAARLATGHYARLDHTGGTTKLIQAVDPAKDQTYFLSSVPAEALRHAMFPLGGLHKSEVREVAIKANLPTAKKRESMGICFVGKRDFGDFISEYIPAGHRRGQFVSVDGQVLGEHKGAYLYTPGQGAKIGGAQGKWFVAGKAGRDVLVALGTHHPALFSDHVLIGEASWVSGSPPVELTQGGVVRCECRLRHQQPLVACEVSLATPADLASIREQSHAQSHEQRKEQDHAQGREKSHEKSHKQSREKSHVQGQNENREQGRGATHGGGDAGEGRGAAHGGGEAAGGTLAVRFASPQRGAAPGQVVALYFGEECLGGAGILSVGPSYHAQGRALPVDESR